MSKKDENQAQRLTNKVVELLDSVHHLELTLSRLKNEGEELLRKLLQRHEKKHGHHGDI